MRDIRSETISIIEKSTLVYNVSNGYLASKRTYDIIGALTLLLFFAPLFTVVIIFIRLVFRGPAFIFEERSGLRGNVFKMFKFRSSPVDGSKWLKHIQSEKKTADGFNWEKDDENLSFAGKIIVKTGIEKLPALFNVIIGDLSLVGPRSPTIWETLNYKPMHILKFSAKPGITGLWRIYKVDRTDDEEMVKVDLKYIRERNFKSDISIMLKTISIIFGASRAA